MNNDKAPGRAEELDEAKLDQAIGAGSPGASDAAARKAPGTGNKVWQDDWLDPK